MKEIYVVLAISLIVFFIVCKSIFKRKIKGYIGEYKVSKVLNRLNKKRYFIFNDIKIMINGSISQIDHVVISTYGIFVIETKNYKGVIKGNESSKEWKQVLNKETRTFYNPILQNQGHVYALQYLFKGIQDLPFHSIIVFTDKAELKTKTTTEVIYPKELVSLIKKFKSGKIDDSVVKELVYRISNNGKSNYKQAIYSKTKSSLLKENCPMCGNSLINRVGKFGKFIGCTNYPTCNFTKN